MEEIDNDATTPAIKYNPRAFMVKKDGVTPRSGADVEKRAAQAAARMAKMRAIGRVDAAVQKVLPKIGTPDQQHVALHGYMMQEKNKYIVDSIQRKKDGGDIDSACMDNIAEILQVAMEDHRSNDSRSFQKNALMAIVSVDQEKKEERTRQKACQKGGNAT